MDARELQPSEIRAHFLEEHERLEKAMTRVEVLSRRIRAGETDRLPQLIGAVHELGALLEEKWAESEELLEPALEEADAWGEVRVRRLRRYQRLQRMAIQETVREVEAGKLPPRRIAEELEELIGEVRESLRRERRMALHPHVLRDDPITIHQTSG